MPRMPIPKYIGFKNDLDEIHKTFKDVKFTDESVQANWNTVLTAMTNLHNEPTTENWNSYLKALNDCHKADAEEWNSPAIPLEDRQKLIDKYNKTYNDSAHENDTHGQENWYLHRLTDRLKYTTESMMTQQSEFEQDKSDLAAYVRKYEDFERDIMAHGVVFDRYTDYAAFENEIKETLKEKESLENSLNMDSEGKNLSELEEQLAAELKKNPNDKKTVEKLIADNKTLTLDVGKYKTGIQEVNEEIKKQEQIVADAKKRVDEITNEKTQINIAAQQEEEKLKKEQAAYNTQLEQTQQAKSELDKVSSQIDTLRKENEAVDAFLGNIDKENSDTKGFFHSFTRISSSVRKKDEIARKNHEIKETFKAVEAANRLADQAKTFQDKFANGDDFGKMIATGINFTEKLEPKNREHFLSIASKEDQHQVALYKEKKMLEQTIRKMRDDLGAYPGKEGLNTFNERMQSPEGMYSVAQEFSNLQDKKMSALFKGNSDAVNLVASKIKQKIANEKIIHVLEQQRQEKERVYNNANGRLTIKKDNVDLQKYVTQKESVEKKLADAVAECTAGQETLNKLNHSLNEINKLYTNDVNQLLNNSKQRKVLETNIDNREKLAKCYNHLKGLNADKKELNDFTRKMKSVAEKGELLHDSLGIDENGKFGKYCTDSAIANLFDSLKRHHDTSMLGKKPGHKDTKAYRGMMDQLDQLMKDGKEDLQKKTPGEIKNILSQLKDGAANYIKAKNEQSFQSWRHSPMRKARLNFAEELMKLCDEGTNQLKKVNEHVKDVQNDYQKFCKPIGKRNSNELTVSDAMGAIKDIRKNAKQLKVNQKKELNKGPVKKQIPAKQPVM